MSNNSSSSSSSDEFFDNMVSEFVEYNEISNHLSNTINCGVLPLVSSTFQRHEVSSTKKKKRAFVPRDREGAHDILVKDYFCDRPLYTYAMFRRSFRMHKHVFLHIVEALSVQDPFFQQRHDATGRLGASTLQKCTTAMRMLAYGISADQVDEYLKLGSSTSRECLAHFFEGVISQFSRQYLRKATAEDVQRLLEEGERHEFSGMMGSIDCMYWEWKNCPVA